LFGTYNSGVAGAHWGSHAIAVAQSSGVITLIDSRSGLLQHSWRTHLGSVHQMKEHKGKLISSSGHLGIGGGSNLNEQVVQVWDVNHQPPKLCKTLKASQNSTFGISFDINDDSEEILATNGNRIICAHLTADDLPNAIPFARTQKKHI